MKFIVTFPLIKLLAKNRVVASWVIAALWVASMAVAFLPGVVFASLLAFAQPTLSILWHKAYRKNRAESVKNKSLGLAHAA